MVYLIPCGLSIAYLKRYLGIFIIENLFISWTVDTLAEFKRLGYKTYDELFDESYDTEKDSDTRLHKVFTQIQQG